MNSIFPMNFFRSTDTTDTMIWKPGFSKLVRVVARCLSLERFSFAFTANAKRQTTGCCLSQKQEKYLILAYFSVFRTCSIAVANRQNIN